MQTGIGKWLHEQNGFGAFELDTITAIFWVFAAAGVVTAAILFLDNIPTPRDGAGSRGVIRQPIVFAMDGALEQGARLYHVNSPVPPRGELQKDQSL
jgi:hypothetical protein